MVNDAMKLAAYRIFEEGSGSLARLYGNRDQLRRAPFAPRFGDGTRPV